MARIRALSFTIDVSVPTFNSEEKIMKNWKQLTRILLITGLFLGVLWIALPPAGEAAETDMGRNISWELTAAALQRTLAGDCDHSGSLTVCREKCDFGQPTGEFACWIG